MANAVISIYLFEKELHKYQKRLEIIRTFEKDRKSFYEIKCFSRYNSNVVSTMLVKVTGYLADSVSVKFYAGDGGIAKEMCTPCWKRLRRSIKYEEISSYKKIPPEDLPLYVGCEHIAPYFKIRRKASNG